MKPGITIIVLILALAGCKKETTSTIPLNEQPDSSIVVTLKKGNFINGPYGSVSGEAKVYHTGTKYQLALVDFTSNNGPDLKVYLSKEVQPINFINLGSLRAISGNQLYDIPAGAIITDYKYALIHCQQYNHLFGSAELKD
jgi:Electron transfer DM13